jgi:acetoin utilization protein AcuB
MDAIIKNYMTEQVHSVRSGETLAVARKMMEKGNFRHLPVLENQKIVGMISDRDFSIVNLYPDMNMEHSKVEDLMMQYVSSFSENAKLSEVVETMAENKHGCAVITGADGKLRGIFTSVDALHLLAKIYDSK